MRIGAGGTFVLAFRDAAGAPRWDTSFPNGVTYQGANYLLDTGFRGQAPSPGWFAGLIDDQGFSLVSFDDTPAAHPGWTEFAGLYLSRRAPWSPAAPSGGLMGYSPISVLQVTADGRVRGAFLADRQPTGTTAGKLYAHGAMGSGLPVTAGGTLSVGYSVRLRNRG